MGRVIYCETTQAATPFIFPNTRVAVYSYEEVCYYFFQNASMITADVFEEPFFSWLQDAIHMPELAEKLKEMKSRKKTLFELLEVFLLAANYCEKAEVQLLFERMKAQAQLPEEEQWKRQADAFLQFRKYVRATRIYDTILKSDHLSPEFAGSIYHNKGVALARNFAWEQAAQCYLKAYEQYPNEVSLSCYLLLFFMQNKEETARKEAQRLQVAPEVYERLLKDYKRSCASYEKSSVFAVYDKIEKEYQAGEKRKADARVERLLKQWKEEYRAETT